MSGNVVQSVVGVSERVPEEIKAIFEEGVLVALILGVVATVHTVGAWCFPGHIPLAVERLLSASVLVLLTIYGVSVAALLSRLVRDKLRDLTEQAPTHGEPSELTALEAARSIEPASGDHPDASARVLVVDDDCLAAESIAAILRADPRIGDIKTVDGPDEGLWELEQCVEAELPDVILVDDSIPGLRHGGIEALDSLRKRAPSARLVVISVCKDLETIQTALAHGADRFLWKNEAGADFAEAVVDAAHSNFVASRSAAAMLSSLPVVHTSAVPGRNSVSS